MIGAHAGALIQIIFEERSLEYCDTEMNESKLNTIIILPEAQCCIICVWEATAVRRLVRHLTVS